MIRQIFRQSLLTAFAAAVVGMMTDPCVAVLYLYEPFNYTAGDALGGVGASMGTPIGQSGTYDAGVGGGAYNWYARGTVSNYQSANDAVVSTGSLSYAGLATSQGNSVSYGSEAPSNVKYADSIALPQAVNSGSIYASFIIRIKSNVVSVGTQFRHSFAGFVNDASTAGNAGGALGVQGGGLVNFPASFWMRKDPLTNLEVVPPIDLTNFSPSKSNTDGIGPAATGASAGWQHSDTAGFTEANQFGALGGQAPPNFADSNTWQTYFVVLKYEFDHFASPVDSQNDTVSLWMNPGAGTLGAANGEANASQAINGNLGSYFAAVNAFGTGPRDVTSDILSFAIIGHRQNTDQTVAVEFDELRIGTTWQDVTPSASAGVPGDYNNNGKVDAADYVLWRKGVQPLPNEVATIGTTDAQDYTEWRARFGNPGAGSGSGLGGVAVPEPASALAGLIAAALLWVSRRR